MRHTYSHPGDPWNELADTIAKITAGIHKGGHRDVRRPPDAVAQMAAGIPCKWAWMMAETGNHDKGPCIDRGCMTWYPVEGESSLEPKDVIHFCPEQAAWQITVHPLSLNMISANVQTMRQKHKYIEEQLVRMKVDVCMLQETRTAGGYCESAHFLRFEAPSEGTWGTAVWLAKTLDQKGLGVKLAKEDVTVVKADPRFTAVYVTKKPIHLLVLSMHVPQQSRPQVEREDLSESLQTVVREHGQTAFVMLGADSNARVPLQYLDVTGDLPFGEEDEYAWRFVEVMSTCSLWIPSTFQCHHTGQSATWQHSRGLESRIDFIAVSSRVDRASISSKVAVELDLLNPNQDHWGVMLTLTVSYSGSLGAHGKL